MSGKPSDANGRRYEKAKVERDNIARELGNAISAWAGVISGLQAVFQISVCRTVGKDTTAREVFNVIHSAETQTDIVATAVCEEYRKYPSVLKTWDILYKRLDKLRLKRNYLAHGEILSISLRGGVVVYCVDFLPFYNGSKFHKLEEHEHWSDKDIGKLCAAFSSAASDLKAFASGLQPVRRGGQPKMPTLSPEPNLSLGRRPGISRMTKQVGDHLGVRLRRIK